MHLFNDLFGHIYTCLLVVGGGEYSLNMIDQVECECYTYFGRLYKLPCISWKAYHNIKVLKSKCFDDKHGVILRRIYVHVR